MNLAKMIDEVNRVAFKARALPKGKRLDFLTKEFEKFEPIDERDILAIEAIAGIPDEKYKIELLSQGRRRAQCIVKMTRLDEV